MGISEYEMKEILKTLMGTYSNFQVNEYTVKAWALALSDFSLEKVQRGVIYCLKEHQSAFAPTTGEFRNYCMEAARTPEYRARLQAEHEEMKQLAGINANAIPMPQAFREMMTRFVTKTSIRDGVIANQAESLNRQEADAKFFGRSNA